MAALAGRDAPPGVDPDAVTAWIVSALPAVVPPLRFDLVPGGRSNLTYRVEDAAGRRLALRRPPVSHVLPTAHDMAREHRILRALWPTPVPVPEPLALCDDAAVTGGPFYLMAFVDGLVLRDAAVAEATFEDPASRRAAGLALADTLATLHGVDPDAVGLGSLARRDGYVERQLRRWREQVVRSAAGGGTALDRLLRVGDALAKAVPPQPATVLVHGDFRLDNAVLEPGGRVAAVLDWELATLGAALADVGTFLDYWSLPDDGEPILGKVPASALPGFPSREEVLERYASSSGRDVSSIAYYMAFGYWRLACILQGVHARYVGGAAAGDPESVEGLPTTVARLVELAAATLGSP